MFVHQGNKKCLLLRFSNDFDHKVDAITFTVIQMNAIGQVLGETEVELQCMNLMPGGMYTPQEGIVVCDNCNDFKIVIKEVFSDHYRYTVRNRSVVTEYLRSPKRAMPPVAKSTKEKPRDSRQVFHGYDDDEPNELDEQKDEFVKETLKVRIKKQGRPGRLAWLAVLTLLVIIGCKVLELMSNWSRI